MTLGLFVVHNGDTVAGTGFVSVDASGVARLAPGAPSEELMRASPSSINLSDSDIGADWDGVWVSLDGRLNGTELDVSSVERVDRPAFPGEPTVHVAGAPGGEWTREAFIAAPDDGELENSDLIIGSGGQRGNNGNLQLTLHCLYIDAVIAEWLQRPHPGDVVIWSALIPR